jgi:6-phosphogluconolactonase
VLGALLLASCGGSAALDGGLDAASSRHDAGGDAGHLDDAGQERDAGMTRTTFVYVGLTDGTLVTFALDAAVLTETSRTTTGDFPSFLAPSPDGRFLYVVHENADEIASLAVDPLDGGVRVVNRQSSMGGGPTHVAVSPDGRFAFAANYNGGSVPVFPIATDGSLGAAIDVESPGAQAHAVVVDAASAHVYVPCKGSDLVAQFGLSASGLEALDPPSVATASGAGPRHLVLSTDERFAYVIDELDSTITVFPRAPDGRLGASTRPLSTLPSGFTGANTTAEILLHPSGRFLFGTNRGHDSIVRLRVEPDGSLAVLGHEPSRGDGPRSMALTPDGDFLLVANQRSRDVQVFAVDPTDGSLAHVSAITTDADAFFVGAFPIPR